MAFALALGLVGCAGGGGGGGPQVAPPASSAAGVGTSGLSSVVPGDGAVRLEWDADALRAEGHTFALFAATSPATLFQGNPIAVDPAGSFLLHAGLSNGLRHSFGMALVTGPGQYERIGPVLRATPRAPIYVDAAANPAVADGLSPATAFPDPISGVLTAQLQGGGNVWLRGGAYDVGTLQMPAGVDLYGGFAAPFALDGIDRQSSPSVLHGALNQITLLLSGGNPGNVVDGLSIDNLDAGLIGIEADDTDVYLRAVNVKNCRGRGIKLFTTVPDHLITAHLVGVRSTGNGADGMYVQGAFECKLEECVFAGNAQEGVEFDDLVGPDGVDASLLVRGSIFANNATEGLDLDLAATPQAGPAGSRFRIDIEQSRFEENQAAGFLLDIDFELVAGWSADIELRGVTARANAGAGVHLDLDWQASTFVQRLLSTSNGGDGLLVSSESRPGLAVVSSSALVGNGGLGMHATLGQVALLGSHCFLAGNRSGAFASDTIRSSIVSSVSWLDTGTWTNVSASACVAQGDPLLPVVANSPSEFLAVIGSNGTRPILAGLGNLLPGNWVELADDSMQRRIVSIAAGAELVLDPAPDFVPAPSGLARFTPGPSVQENYALAPGSIALGAGMALPGSPPVDAGILASPSAGAPGSEDARLLDRFRVGDSSFAIGQALPKLQAVEFGFEGGIPQANSINANSVRVLNAAGGVLSVSLSLVGGRLQIAPPPGGWPTTGLNLIEIYPALRASDGRSLAAPLAIAFRAV